MTNSLKVLGVESSCDDTAAAILEVSFQNSTYTDASVRSSIVLDQKEVHNSFGGVVPELAARAHSEKLDYTVELALKEANTKLNDIDLISVTTGPGLIGGLLSGVMFSKAVALALNKPIVGVNHLAGHALSPRLCRFVPFPYLTLLISGGHCQFLIVKNSSTYQRLGTTIDDAPGEAFDKSAKLLGLNYPGGPEIEKRALNGNPNSYSLPAPLIFEKNSNMSFSGLKTALRREVEKCRKTSSVLPESTVSDLCASFQKTIIDIFVKKSERAMSVFEKLYPSNPKTFALVGGVAANTKIREALRHTTEKFGFEILTPAPKFCTDNGAMIACAGAHLFIENKIFKENLIPRARWPLDLKANPVTGSGKKGRKS